MEDPRWNGHRINSTWVTNASVKLLENYAVGVKLVCIVSTRFETWVISWAREICKPKWAGDIEQLDPRHFCPGLLDPIIIYKRARLQRFKGYLFSNQWCRIELTRDIRPSKHEILQLPVSLKVDADNCNFIGTWRSFESFWTVGHKPIVYGIKFWPFCSLHGRKPPEHCLNTGDSSMIVQTFLGTFHIWDFKWPKDFSKYQFVYIIPVNFHDKNLTDHNSVRK